ncbi:MAG: DUF87 domain-containing protein [Candidatus Thorarchaeota archaeon]|nr:DUF87 domain-containing protein [Candidatus Thorarchaeota archaeon]
MIRIRPEPGKSGYFTVSNRHMSLIRLGWIICMIGSGVYLLIVYLMPLFGATYSVLIPNRLFVETFLCLLPLLIGSVITKHSVSQTGIDIVLDDEFLLLKVYDRTLGLVCLNLATAAGSVINYGEKPMYNTAMLLALRAGMDRRTSFAYEVGVMSGRPFLRIFITTSANNADEIKDILRREATRTEAILLASLERVEINLAKNDELAKVIQSSTGASLIDGFKKTSSDSEEEEMLIVKGNPKVFPTERTSQIGTFISTALRQGYSLSLTSVFSKAKPGRERRAMERKWRSIKAKEKTNDDSLADQAEKRALLGRYEEINENSGWFDSSLYLIVRGESPAELKSNVEGVRGLFLSIWGGDDSISIHEKSVSQRLSYRLLMRRHVKQQRLHANTLAAYVNTPVQQLPVIASAEIPLFQIPSSDYVENDLPIGWAIYGEKRLGSVGLQIEWLREHIAILGATGTGKTTLVKKLMTELSTKTNVPWWIFDVKGSEYSDLAKLNDVVILRPGLDPAFVIDLFDVENDSHQAHSTFVLLRELLRENSSTELSPAMEKLLREAVTATALHETNGNSLEFLIKKVNTIANNDRTGQMTRDALLNRLEILTREPLGSILRGGSNAFSISNLMNRRVVFDLRYVSRVGGMDSVRLLYNLVAKRIFDSAMKRGIISGLHHVVVLEEASNLVPESYTRNSAADVTTGESMVMLQRATGQGVVVVSTRPNISTNILANTSTKITFRLPYDSQVGGRFMSIEPDQEQYLRTMQRGRALILMPHCNVFEIETDPFTIYDYIDSIEETVRHSSEESEDIEVLEPVSVLTSESKLHSVQEESERSEVFDRIGGIASHVIALLASQEITTQDDILGFLKSLDSKMSDADVTEILRDLVSLSTIQREAIPLVSGGFVYSASGKGLSAVKKVIANYLLDRLGESCQLNDQGQDGPDILIDDSAIIIIPEHLRASSFDSVVEVIRHHMGNLRNGVKELVVIIRGSVAAAKLREILDKSEEFDAVSVVSAFPSSLDKLIMDLIGESYTLEKDLLDLSDNDPDSTRIDLIEAVHDVGPATSRAVQMRLWFGLIQDFVDISKGRVVWEALLEFIETTALQSKKGRAAPMNSEEGRRALTELLADEMLVAVRMGTDKRLVDIEEGLWIVNTAVLRDLKEQAIHELTKELKKRTMVVHQGHGYYDLCADKKSYAVFPTQQELNTLLRLHSEIACRTCESTEMVCILTASEYLDDSVVTPSNLIMRTMDDGLASIII